MKKDYQTQTQRARSRARERDRGDGRHRRDDEGGAAGHGRRRRPAGDEALMDESVTAICGPEGQARHRAAAPCATGTRTGSVTLGGRRVAVRRRGCGRPTERARSACPRYEHFTSTELLGEMAMEKMLAKLSTRRYRAGLEPVGDRGRGGQPARRRSRRCPAASSAPPRRPWPSCWPVTSPELDLVALMVDGVHFADHCCVVAMGIGIDGTKHPLAVVEGVTENATVVTDLLVGLRDRGLDVTRPVLVVIDGAKALAGGRAGGVRPPGDRPLPTAQDPKRRVRNCPKALARPWPKKMRAAYRNDDALAAEAELEDLARQLQRPIPARPGRCAKDSQRRSPSCASACPRPLPARCARPTPSSR